MRREHLTAFQEWFKQYVEVCHCENPQFHSWIRLKDSHTRRVFEKITRIGRSLGLGEEDLLTAGAIGLFHDVGRFRQIKMYGTFNDGKSENHATLGTRVLKESGVLADLPEEEGTVILKAIDLHNLRDLPEGLPDRLLLFARLIRDADKLDILEVFSRYYTSKDDEFATALDSYLPDTPGYSRALVEDLLIKKRCSYSDIKNRNDRKLLNLSWVYDINFPYTLSEIVENGFLDIMIGSLPQSSDIQAIHRHIEAYVAQRLGRAVRP
ncbi:MAG: HD domain-containing protein [Firmicutes bacterium]|nr:HD domain-containing protein [Bacillota bacterium]MCL5058990.1 HD domain-containing protein [Actinomycetota bacterium]